ncbi:DAGKc domain-containing protein [Aphelenchoides fujianensis]|nr:DAGKc domain-containing protein [Aphelenchoides fujianensis]
MAARLVSAGQTAWNHKKKLVFFGSLGAYGVNWAREWNREQKIRSDFARRAETIGRESVSPDYQPLKLLVFIDQAGEERLKNVNSFNKNVLPLLILAGMDVRVHVAADAAELAELSRSADVRNCAGVCVVGSRRFAVPHVLDGLFVHGGGDEARTALAVFDPADRDQVEKRCRKALDIIHGIRQRAHVFTTRIHVKSEESEQSEAPPVEPRVDLRLADVSFGWFDYFRERQTKFWIFGSLADRMACTWYLIKHFPQPLRLSVHSTAHCPGCRRCVSEAPQDAHEQQRAVRWWQRWIGRREQPSDRRRRQFATVVNPECGRPAQSELEAMDVEVHKSEDGVYGALQLRTVPAVDSRWSLLWRVWTEWRRDESPANFFVAQPTSQTVDLRVESELHDVLRESASHRRLQSPPKDAAPPTAAIRRIEFETTGKTVQLY